jgi:hypothetical protein
MDNDRKTESRKAAKILRRILDANPAVSGVSPRMRKWALELAISLLDARALDAQED